jgi:hypothetical protein
MPTLPLRRQKQVSQGSQSMKKIFASRWTQMFLVLVALYSAYWFHMAGEIKTEIHDWVAEQAKEGTEVSFENLKVSGYPLFFIASIDNPDIFVRDGDRRPHWQGERLQIRMYAFYLKHIAIHFRGTQTIVIEEDIGPMARPPAAQRLTFNGDSINLVLGLNNGRISLAKARFHNVTMDIEEIGDYRPIRLKDFPKSITVRLADIYSKVRPPSDNEPGSIAHDYSVDVTGLTTERGAPDGFAKEIRWMGFDLTETGDEEISFHNGSLRIDNRRTRTGDKYLVVHKAGIEWHPITIGLAGHLTTPEGGKADGLIDVTVSGQRHLVRTLADQGDISTLTAILTGAFLGIVEMIAVEDEEGVTHIPLKVRDGDISYSFLPLTSIEELRQAAGLN